MKSDLGQLRAGSTVVITLKQQANVLLMDLNNYRRYSSGRGGGVQYYGGLVKRSPARIKVPRNGHWYLAIDLGGRAGRVSAAVAVEPPPRGALPPLREPADALRGLRNTQPELPPVDIMGGQTWDVFISHAGEDKETVARPLAEALRTAGISVWLDVLELRIGDSLRRKIDQGIRSSRFGVVVCSAAFFAKGWPQYELDGLVTRTVAGEQNLLPIWHGVTRDDVMAQSPSLADKVALATGAMSLQEIADEIASVVVADDADVA
jgi:hypothetical protein